MSIQVDSSDSPVQSTINEDDAHAPYSSVNPLWMITAGLACFFLLLLLVSGP